MPKSPSGKKRPSKKDMTEEEFEKKVSTVVLARELLPESIYIIPGITKPVFPGMVFPVVLPEGPYAEVLNKVADGNDEKIVGFVLTKEELDDDEHEKLIKKLYKVGTVARILNFRSNSDGSAQALLQGVSRFKILKVISTEGPKIKAYVQYLKEKQVEGDEIKALSMAIMKTLRELVKNNPLFSEEIKMFLSQGSWDYPERLADFAVTITSSTNEELQDVLECLDIQTRLEKALFLLRKELNLNELKEKITDQITEKISKQQREFFLHEQLKAIKHELGLEKDEKAEEIEKYVERTSKLTLPPEAEERISEELEKLKVTSPQSPEYAVSRNYLDWLTILPWGISTEDKLDVEDARKILDRDHFGLQDIKERILEFISISKLRGTVSGSILCLLGPPGVGKTSLGRAVAESLGRKFYRFALGGMKDEAEIKGHRRTYIGAMPGKLIHILRNTSSQNPVIMLDEIDKVGASYHGDPASALLEVLDPEQNQSFLDHYLDVPFDLSKVLFITTANVPDTIPGPLLDRMEIIHLSGYINREKLMIAKNHLISRLLPEHGLSTKDVKFTEGAIKFIIDGYAREAGVRTLEKSIRRCLRKVAVEKAKGEMKSKIKATIKVVEKWLGQPTFADDILINQRFPGVVNGLAWTSLGGAILFIEAMAIPGKPDLKQTGQLGDVMLESTSIAFSLVKSNLEKFGISRDFFDSHMIHLHVPAGATPKDGPSAGVAMATALISIATSNPQPKRMAMTGELTLTGAVLPVGGVREKVIAANRGKISNVIMPKANEKDFMEIPEDIRSEITPHFVRNYSEVYSLVFTGGIDESRSSN